MKYIISGGPGSGKSTLINGLNERGYSYSAEVSRRMIMKEAAKNSDCLPWLDIQCFSDKVLYEMIKEWDSTAANSITFFDRGIPDIIAYLRFAALQVPANYYTELVLHPYYPKVLILPPWEAIYINDSERWHTFEEAAAIYKVIKDTYITCGFEVIEVPKVSLAERIAFVELAL